VSALYLEVKEWNLHRPSIQLLVPETVSKLGWHV